MKRIILLALWLGAAVTARAVNSPWVGVYEGTTTSIASGLANSTAQLRVAVWADGVVAAVASLGGIIESVGNGTVAKNGAVALTVTASVNGTLITVYPVGTVKRVGASFVLKMTFLQGAYQVTSTGTLKKQG